MDLKDFLSSGFIIHIKGQKYAFIQSVRGAAS